MTKEINERIKEYEKYIQDNKIFVPEKFVYGELIVGLILIAISYYWLEWLKYIGIILLVLVAIDHFRRQGHRMGFLKGYDEGYIDGYDRCEEIKES